MINLSHLKYGVQLPLEDTIYVMKRPKSTMTKAHRDGNVLPDYQLLTTIEKTRDYKQEIDKYFIKSSLFSSKFRYSRICIKRKDLSISS